MAEQYSGYDDVEIPTMPEGTTIVPSAAIQIPTTIKLDNKFWLVVAGVAVGIGFLLWFAMDFGRAKREASAQSDENTNV